MMVRKEGKKRKEQKEALKHRMMGRLDVSTCAIGEGLNKVIIELSYLTRSLQRPLFLFLNFFYNFLIFPSHFFPSFLSSCRPLFHSLPDSQQLPMTQACAQWMTQFERFLPLLAALRPPWTSSTNTGRGAWFLPVHGVPKCSMYRKNIGNYFQGEDIEKRLERCLWTNK